MSDEAAEIAEIQEIAAQVSEAEPEAPEPQEAEEAAPEAVEEPTEAPEEAPAPQQERPEGWDRVDFENDDPKKIEQRFNRLYGQMKRQGEMLNQMGDDNRKLMERLNGIEKSNFEAEQGSKVEALERSIQEASRLELCLRRAFLRRPQGT